MAGKRNVRRTGKSPKTRITVSMAKVQKHNPKTRKQRNVSKKKKKKHKTANAVGTELKSVGTE